MGPGSHVGFPISANNKNLVYDHPMNISAIFSFVMGKRRSVRPSVSFSHLNLLL
jgi:hypothetical protein